MIINRIRNEHIALIACILIMASCSVVRPYGQPAVSTEGLFRDSIPTDSITIAELPYRDVFSDTILQKLISDGLANNLNLRIAYTRIQQSEAYLQQSRLAFLPSLNANATVGVSKFSNSQKTGVARPATQYQLGVSSSWEADI